MRTSVLFSLIGLAAIGTAQSKFDAEVTALRTKGLTEKGAFGLLTELTSQVGNRINGSANAQRAVEWGQATMTRLGFQNVRLVPCMVPNWVRGDEQAFMQAPGGEVKLTCCALGSSPGTPAEGVTGDVIEVHSLQEVVKLGDQVKGKIVFFNRPFDDTLTNQFEAYGRAADQRFAGPGLASKQGAIGVLVRSMTSDPDDTPHTGVTRYDEKFPKAPAAALSIKAANDLSDALKAGPVKVRLVLGCKDLPEVPSASVIGEILGSERPDEVIVMGGHLDSWDKGTGAHDDGAGVTQSLEALRLLKELGWKPKRTIRVVLFMNEERSGTGAEAYAAMMKVSRQKSLAAMESDSGGFAPRGFGVSLKANQLRKVNGWLPALRPFEIDGFRAGGEGGADVEPLGPIGAVLFGLEVESQRYFDYHHSDEDTLDKVNRRELELGAMAMAMLAWRISQDGL